MPTEYSDLFAKYEENARDAFEELREAFSDALDGGNYQIVGDTIIVTVRNDVKQSQHTIVVTPRLHGEMTFTVKWDGLYRDLK